MELLAVREMFVDELQELFCIKCISSDCHRLSRDVVNGGEEADVARFVHCLARPGGYRELLLRSPRLEETFVLEIIIYLRNLGRLLCRLNYGWNSGFYFDGCRLAWFCRGWRGYGWLHDGGSGIFHIGWTLPRPGYNNAFRPRARFLCCAAGVGRPTYSSVRQSTCRSRRCNCCKEREWGVRGR